MAAFKYRAFISYSHRDREWGDWLHKSLESYRVPRRLAGTPGRDGPVPARLFPIFRDREELPTSDDLSSQITSALGESEYLIVICSPQSAQSRWVNEEILAYKRLGRESHILPIIVDGEPNASDKPAQAPAQLECFPQALKYHLGPDGRLSGERTEPIAADARGHADGRENAKLKLIAGLLGVGYDALKQRDLEAQRIRFRRLTLIAGGVIASLSLLLVLSLFFLFTSERVRNEAQRAQSLFLARDANIALIDGDVRLAALLALAALPGDVESPDRPIEPAAIGMLTQSYFDWRPVRLLPKGAALPALAEAKPPASLKIETRTDDFFGKTTVTLRDAVTRTVIATIEPGTFAFATALAPDGKHVVTLTFSKNTPILWDGGGKKVAALAGLFYPQFAVFSPDGSRVVLGSLGVAIVWDTATGMRLATLTLPTGESVTAAAFSMDGKRVVTGSQMGTARIWDVATEQQLALLAGQEGPVASVAFSRDGRQAVVIGDNHVARLWDINLPERRLAAGPSQSAFDASVFSPDGGRLVLAASDAVARVFDTATFRTVLKLPGGRGAKAAVFSADGTRIASSDGARVALWDAASGRMLTRLAVPCRSVKRITFSHDDSRLLMVGEDGDVCLWSLAENRLLAKVDGRDAEFSDDGARLAVSGPGLRVLDAQTGRVIADMFQAGEASASGALSSGGHMAVATATWGDIFLLDVDANQSRIFRPESPSCHRESPKVFCIGDVRTLSPDGGTILTTSADGAALYAWDAAADEPASPLRTAVAIRPSMPHFSTDGRRIVAGSRMVPATIWDAADMTRLAILPSLTRLRKIPDNFASWRAVFSPDGSHVAALGDNHEVRVWAVPRCQPLVDAMRGRLAQARFKLSPQERSRFFLNGVERTWLDDAYTTIRPLFAWILPRMDRCA